MKITSLKNIEPKIVESIDDIGDIRQDITYSENDNYCILFGCLGNKGNYSFEGFYSAFTAPKGKFNDKDSKPFKWNNGGQYVYQWMDVYDDIVHCFDDDDEEYYYYTNEVIEILKQEKILNKTILPYWNLIKEYKNIGHIGLDEIETYRKNYHNIINEDLNNQKTIEDLTTFFLKLFKANEEIEEDLIFFQKINNKLFLNKNKLIIRAIKVNFLTSLKFGRIKQIKNLKQYSGIISNDFLKEPVTKRTTHSKRSYSETN